MRRARVAILGVLGLWIGTVATAHALRLPPLLDAADALCPTTPLAVPDELRRAALRLAEAGYARNAAVVLDDTRCELVGAPLALEAAFADTLLDDLRLLPAPPTLAIAPERVPAARLVPPRRRHRPPLVLHAAAAERAASTTFDAVAVWRRGLLREARLGAGLGVLRVAPTPHAVGIGVEASYATRQLSVSARFAQSLPAITPTPVAVGELGIGLRYRGRRLTVQLDWGRTYLGLARLSDVAAALLVVPL